MCAFSAYLQAPELLAAVRLHPAAVRRQRKLPFTQLLATLLSGMTASVQNELNVFAANLANRAELWREVSAQAFSKARQGLSHRVFDLLNQHLLVQVGQHLPMPRWRGFRLVAADASKLQLFLQDVTGRKVREAIAFVLYLPGPGLSLCFELYSARVGERQMLFEHLDALQPDDLLLLDRGYPARWVIAALQQRQRHFCMRVDATGFAAANALLRSARGAGPTRSAFETGRQGLRRPTQAPHRPPDSCDGPERPMACAHDLTARRGALSRRCLCRSVSCPLAHRGLSRAGRREAFKRIKHRLQLEHLSGLSWLAAQQDPSTSLRTGFGAKLVCDNLNALAVYASHPIDHADATPDAPRYQPNRTYGIALLKRWLPRWLLRRLPDLDTLLRIFQELLTHVVRFVPGRSNPRPKGPKPHLHHAYKSIA